MPVFGMLLMGDKKFRMKPMPNLLKKILLSFFAFLIIFTSIAPSFLVVKAQDTMWYNQNFVDWYKKVYDQNTSPPSEIFGERYTAAQVQWVVYGLIALPVNFLGDKMQTFFTCILAANPLDIVNKVACTSEAIAVIGDIGQILSTSISQSGSAPARNTNFAHAVFSNASERPLSGIGYVEKLAKKFSLVSSVNAQGFGYNTALDGLKKYWGGFRDMAYAIAVLVTIVFAFMIMFRVKINPQTVITVQSAIPKVVIALVLATFSYAIAGFVIDLSYVVGGLFASLMNLAGFSRFDTAFSFIVPIDPASKFLGGFYIFFIMLVYTLLFFIAAVMSLASTILGALSIFGGLVSIVFIIITLWVLVLSIYYLIKIPWMLIKNLISLFISIVVAPLQIVLGAVIPSLSFGQWLKKIISEALVFPVTGLFIFLAYITAVNSISVSLSGSVIGPILDLLGIIEDPGTLWSPPIIGSNGLSGILWLGASFSLIIMVPKVAEFVKSLIMGEKFSFGSAIGEASTIGKAGALGYGTYGIGSLAQGAYPWPYNLLRRSPLPSGGVEQLTPSEKTKQTADALREPISILSKMLTGR
jgi:hypothetical protein